MIDLKTLQWRLAETINWCTSRVNPDDPQNCLRSSELNPHIEDPFDSQINPDYNLVLTNWQKAVDELTTKRANLLRQENSYPEFPVEKLKTGRLLIFFPEKTLQDGGAAVESQKFFDWDDIPPWDTWVSFLVTEEVKKTFYVYGSFIICWIPDQFKELADYGKCVSMGSSICWADNLDEQETRELKENNLLPVLEAILAQISN